MYPFRRCKTPGAAGTCTVVRTAYSDPTAKGAAAEKGWVAVDIKFESKFARQVPLAELRVRARAQFFFIEIPPLFGN